MDEPAIRASDAEREQTMERLRAAAGEGRLTLEELADRIEAASGARTREQLEPLTRDLPEPRTGFALSADTPATVPTPASAQSTSVFGDLRRDGAWLVPARSGWKTVFGDVKLDVREAQVSDAVVEIEANTFFGDVELLVPEGVAVEIRSRAVFGDVKQNAGAAVPAGAPRIVLIGGTVFGDVRVQEKRLRERLAERWRRRGGAGS